MTYAYIIDNTTGDQTLNNSALFQFVDSIDLDDDNIYCDMPFDRTAIKELFNKLESGDTLILRSIQDLVDKGISQLITGLCWLHDHKIELVSINEPDYKFHSLFKKLRDIDRYYAERNRTAGFEQAKKEGRVGRPQNPNIQEAIQLYREHRLTVDEIQKITGVPSATLYRHLLKANDKK